MAEAFAVSVATGFLGNFSSEILLKLGAFATTHEIPLMWGLTDELEKLKNTTDMILAVLEDAEKRQAKSQAVGLWLQRLKQAVYDAEDVLDEVAYEILRRKMDNSMFTIPLAFRDEMAHKVQDAIRNLDDIAKQKNQFNLKEGQASADKTSLDRETSQFFIDTEVFGREDEKSKIINMLLDDSAANEEENFFVISIVGFGGLGKTTLAQLVFNDEEVSKRFDVREWVCVANDRSSDKTLLGEVFREICKSQPGSSNKGQMQKSLLEKLKTQKFLLVFDDVWDSSQWGDVRVILRCGAQGSKVIVTTRSEEVANEMRTLNLIKLGKLSEVHCWTVFEQRAFGRGGPKKTHDLEVIGRKIVVKCQGVPLAVKTLGSLMYRQKTFEEWKAIENSEKINVVGENDVMNVLALSYDHLPSPVKQCFLYCAIFPKDATIMKDDLIQRWMAQGLIQSSNDLENEEVGNEFFKTLCWNSFFQNIKDEKNGIVSCQMHDLIHDLAQLIMGKELLVFSHSNVAKNIDMRETVHLIMYFRNMSTNFATPENFDKAKKLRTCFSFVDQANDTWSYIWLKFKHVRVLHLEEIKEVPSSICELKLLRYLRIASGWLKVLPQSVCQLYCLETLNVCDCHNLKELPKDMWKLINLRHLYIGRYTKIPMEIGSLGRLRTIAPILFLGKVKNGGGIKLLEHLNNLSGYFRIHDMEEVKNVWSARKAKLREKEKIYYLEMKWETSTSDFTMTNYSEIVEALDVPPNLKELSMIEFPGVKLPLTTWLANGALPYLVDIKLQFCRNIQEIPPIWHMQPSLEILEIGMLFEAKLLGGKFTSTRAPVGSRLRRLFLKILFELEEWVENTTITANSFPCLEELIVEGCRMLKITPTHFPALKEMKLEDVYEEGVWSMLSQPSSLNSLEKLEIHYSGNLTSLGNLTGLPRLEKLRISLCWELALTLASFPSLKEIYLYRINRVDVKCSSATNDGHHHLTSLTSLHVEYVSEFTGVPKGFLQSSSSEHLQSVSVMTCGGFQGFVPAGSDGVGEDEELPLFSSNLKRIEIKSCPDVEAMDVRGLTSLESLEITDCKRLQSSPLGLQSLRALKKLSLEYPPTVILTGYDVVTGACCWPHLQMLEISFCKNVAVNTSQFPSLTRLQFSSIDCIVMEPVANNRLTSLTHLSIVGVKEFTSLPQGLLQSCAKHLQELHIEDCSTFQGFVRDELQGLESLKKLHVEGCPCLTSFDESCLHSLPPLHTLRIGGFSEELDHLPFPTIEQDDHDSPLCSSLQHLTIWGWSKIKSLPQQLQHLTALTDLQIRHFDALTALPDWLGNLSSLRRLEIIDCQSLIHLPSEQQMQCLTSLYLVNFKDCPFISERFRSDDLEQLKILGYQLSYEESTVKAHSQWKLGMHRRLFTPLHFTTEQSLRWN